jgi:hypothetical protein
VIYDSILGDNLAVSARQTLLMSWELDGNANFATARRGEHRLTVERLPDQNIWEWIVWGRLQPDAAQHGVAESVFAAMREAYLVARTWNAAIEYTQSSVENLPADSCVAQFNQPLFPPPPARAADHAHTARAPRRND